MAAKKRITHRDVALAAGVSTAVVSYVINNGPRPTSVEIRERVLNAIRELDYHPNAMARGLRARRTNMIGYIAYDYNPLDVFTSSYNAGIMTGLTAELKDRDYYLLIYPIAIEEDPRSLEMLLRSERLDGVVIRLVEDAPTTDSLIERIVATGTPCVCIERPPSSRFGLPTVSYNDIQGGYDATYYLIERGHRRIGHICGDLRYASARGRLEGYRQALREYGLTEDPALIDGADDWAVEIAAGAVKRMLALPEPPTAVFAANDDFALRAIEVIHERHLRVPHDLMVIGFDDIPAASQARPALTTMRIPLLDLGRRAADHILDLIQDDEDVRQLEELPVELVRRESA